MNFPFKYVMPFIVLFFLSSCATMQVSKDVQSGRTALMLGQPKEALTHFEAAAALDPNYTTRFTLLDTGIWTYVGRAYYEIGEKKKALASLKRAKDSSSNDYVGRIYLGLVMSQNGSRREGIGELEAGLKGLAIWLESLPDDSEDGQYWDSEHRIANGISELLKMVQVESSDWAGIATNVEWLGKALEEEIKNSKEEYNENEGGGGDDDGM